jgi:hypothetical protein
LFSVVSFAATKTVGPLKEWISVLVFQKARFQPTTRPPLLAMYWGNAAKDDVSMLKSINQSNQSRRV